MKKRHILFFVTLMLAIAMLATTALAHGWGDKGDKEDGDKEKETSVYLDPESSSGAEVWYLTEDEAEDHGFDGIKKLDRGDYVSGEYSRDESDIIVFFVKTKPGFEVGTTFQHRLGKNFNQWESYTSGIYSSIIEDDGEYVLSADNAPEFLTSAILKEAAEAGFTNEFHYTLSQIPNRAMVKITCSPVETVKVTFVVENGSWANGNTEDIVIDVNKGFSLYAQQIPTGMEPETGYKGGSWNPEPDTSTKLNEDVTYTYTFAQAYILTVNLYYKPSGQVTNSTVPDQKITKEFTWEELLEENEYITAQENKSYDLVNKYFSLG